MPKTANAIYCWDITWKYDGTSREDVLTWCKDHADKWAFQHEVGTTTGYHHWQLRVSLRDKCRAPPGLPPEAHYTPTATENRSNFTYVTKDHTRVQGPWRHTDEDIFVPWHLAGKLETLYPWQKTIWDSADLRQEREINVIYDPVGCQGKSTIASLMDVYNRGIEMTAYNDYKLVTQSLCNMLKDTNNRDPRCILFDLERARAQHELAGLYSAIESIKKGLVADWRNHYIKWRFHPPIVWVFMNTLPDRAYATKDRWKIWEISASRELQELQALAL